MTKHIKQALEKTIHRVGAKLAQPGWWLELLSASLLTAAYLADGEPAGPLLARWSFTLLWAGLILSLLFSTIVAASLAVSGQTSSESKPNTTFDWCLDIACWALIGALGWLVTAVVFLIACVWRHLTAVASAQARARLLKVPDINPASGVQTFQAQLSDLQLELHADGLLVPTSDYLLCDAGLALREPEQTQADLRLLVYKRPIQPDGGRGPQQLLFCIPVIGSYWPGVFANQDAAMVELAELVDDAPVIWPEELGQKGDSQ